MPCCSKCGQTLPTVDLFGVALRGEQRRIVEIVQRAGRHGIPSATLLDALYADDPNGGPEHAKASMHTRIYLINKKLKPMGKMIRAPRGCSTDNRYRVENFP